MSNANVSNDTITVKRGRLEWALVLAAKGFRILVLRPGSKQPCSGRAWGVHATSDPAAIRAMFAASPDMNFGVCPATGYVIIDLDQKPGADGVKAFGELELEHELAPDTFTVRTRSGGLHLYFKVPEEVGNANTFPDGIDVRGVAGYVVGPGCEVGGKAYTHESGDLNAIADCPKWMRQFLGRSPRKDSRRADPLCELDLKHNVNEAERFLARREPAIQGQNGNDWTWETVAFLRDMGLSDSMCLEVILASEWNVKRCEPAWAADELAELIEHVYDYAENRGGSKRAPLSQLRQMADVIPLYPEQYPEWQEQQRREHEAAVGLAHVGADIRADIPDDGDSEGGRFGRWDGAAMRIGDAAKAYGRPEFLIPGFLRATGVNAILAFRETGKTLIMVDMALRGALNMSWHGWPIIPDCHHIMFASEDTDGTTAHILAWCKHHGLDIRKPSDRARLDRFILIPEEHRPDLPDAADCEKLATYLKDMLPAGARGVLWVDTWQAVTVGASQKDSDIMSAAMRNAEGLAKAVNGAVVSAYHPPKSQRETISGAGQLEDAGFSIVVAKSDENRRGYVEVKSMRLKGAPRGSYINFRIEGVDIGGRNAHGEPYRGAVLVEDLGRTLADTPEEKKTERLAIANTIRRKIEDSDDGKKWALRTVAEQLAGQIISFGDGEKNLPGRKGLLEMLPKIFARPVEYPGEGLALELVETEKVGGKTVREFRLRKIEIEDMELAEPMNSATNTG